MVFPIYRKSPVVLSRLHFDREPYSITKAFRAEGRNR